MRVEELRAIGIDGVNKIVQLQRVYNLCVNEWIMSDFDGYNKKQSSKTNQLEENKNASTMTNTKKRCSIPTTTTTKKSNRIKFIQRVNKLVYELHINHIASCIYTRSCCSCCLCASIKNSYIDRERRIIKILRAH